MPVNENKLVARRFLEEVLNAKDYGRARSYLTPDAKDHLTGSATALLTLAAFPDFALNLEHVIAEEDIVTVLATFTGNHQEEFMGITPTSKGVTGRVAFSFRMEDEQIAERRTKIEPSGTPPTARRPGPQFGVTPRRGRYGAIICGRRARAPEFAVNEIQGNALPGFHTHYLTLVFLEILDSEQAASWLRRLRIATMADVLWAREGRGRPSEGVDPPWVNVALSFTGLSKLCGEADRLTDAAFKQGMHRRSSLLADPTAPDAEGNPDNWVIGGPGGQASMSCSSWAQTSASRSKRWSINCTSARLRVFRLPLYSRVRSFRRRQLATSPSVSAMASPNPGFAAACPKPSTTC